MDNELPLLLTKLELPPLRAHTLQRGQLLALLRSASEIRLVLASAPAGFGKTTLLASWCHARAAEDGAAVAWITLDEGDNDPARFLAYLIAAVTRALASPDGGIQQATPGREVHAELVLTRLINTIVAAGRPCLLVLDDYHLISAPAVHSAVAFLLGHLPEGSCLAIGGRADPPLPLARLHVRGQLVEVRAADLRFSENEVRAFLDTIGVGRLPPAEIEAIIALAEGWPAGAQLLALALRSGASLRAGADSQARPDLAERSHHLFAYLADEVFMRQPPATRSFLLRTSILDRMCGPLCDALLGPDSRDSSATLAELDQASLFVVPIDAEHRWYRYHHLFRSFLSSRLTADEPALSAELHRRAGDWCLRNGLPAGALEHAFAAADSERAVSLIERLALTLIERGEYATLRQWLAQVPPAARASHPSLDLWDAWAALLTGAVEQIGPALGRAVRAWESAGNRAGLGAAAHLQAHLARLSGDADGAISAARAALADLPAAEVTLRAGSMLALGVGQLLADDLDAAEATLEEALVHCTAHNFLGALAAHTALGDLALRRGQLAAAGDHYERVLADSGDHTHWERWVASGRLGEIAIRRGQLHAACELLRASLDAAERIGVAVYLIPTAIAYARTLAALDDGLGAQQALERALQHAHRLGSSRYQRQIRDELAQLRPAPATAHVHMAAQQMQHLVEPLSEREVDVLQLVASGASNQDIAEQLVISVGTVKSHLNHILGKLEARNRTEAVARARTLGVLA